MERLHHFRLLAFAGAVLFLSGTFTQVRAQEPDDLKRGVARISLINGDVSVRRGDSGEWVAGVINAPLLTDDRIATGPNSRSEVQFDSSNLLRLGANAELRLTQLEYGRYQMELAHGVMTYRMLRTTDPNVEIDTPTVSVRPSRQGSFRISVNDAGETEVIARNGDVEVFTPHGSQWVRSGQTLMARGANTDAEFQIVPADGMDEWDRWCDSRDRMITQSVSSRYVGSGIYGAEDLDSAGTWNSVPEYGYVWRPTGVSADWAPYQAGRWAWEDWYGWTWVSSDPWGWAPYHYGRWFHHDRMGWCWYPGLISARHYWSPALVGFIGFGGGGGIGFGFGNVGWVPLAPYEVFHPWWGRGYYGNRGYNRNINITNVNVTNIYRNSRVNGGIHAVGTNDFQNGRFHNITRTSGDRIHDVGAIRGQMPFTGGAANQRFSDRQATVIPRGNQNTKFFTHQQPNPVQRGGFGQGGQQGVQAGGRQNEPNGLGNQQQQNNLPAQRATGQPGQQSSQPNRGMGQSAQDSSGWRRFGSPSNQPAAGQGSQPPQGNRNNVGGQQFGTGQAQRSDRPGAGTPQVSQPAAPRTDNRGGWQRFGSPGGGSVNSAPEQRQAPTAPRQEFRSSPNNDRPSYGGGNSNRQESLRITPPVVRERPATNDTRRQQSAPGYSAPSYSAPRQNNRTYEAPRQNAPSYSAPRQSAPSAPRQNSPSSSRGNSGGGGNKDAPRGNSGNGGGHGRR